jgi:hypothetical protein
LSNHFDGKYIYNLLSAENGNEILRNVDFISTHLVISFPKNLTCYLKSFFYHEEGNLIYNYSINAGIQKLEPRCDQEMGVLPKWAH